MGKIYEPFFNHVFMLFESKYENMKASIAGVSHYFLSIFIIDLGTKLDDLMRMFVLVCDRRISVQANSMKLI